ncbi:hypothetical protein [Paenibacillus andongensis]|uniref:hypothetical protein n=1 Tax=Paenibacillus andongensis TaxID=2975482 RepID=UPI0021BB2861|nr:hypothetical protein [Paenibacillus andongensis]
MPIIQLNPQLQNSVYKLKHDEGHKIANPFLSKEESSALTSIFNYTKEAKQKKPKEPVYYWI